MTEPDRRLNAYRPDLASAALKGKVKAERFVTGQRAQVTQPVVDMRPTANHEAGIDTQLIRGDTVTIFETREGWAWCQAERDGYVGYIADDALVAGQNSEPTHRVCVPRTFAYAVPDMKTPRLNALSLGSCVTVTDEQTVRGTRYLITDQGEAIVASHLSRVAEHESDYVSVAELLIHTPYLWGGSSAFGIDCSGLVQLSMLLAGKKVLRDTDMQEATLGHELGFAAMNGGLQRGDLVFWKGHVGIMADAATVIHANGHTMTVARELLEDAIERIRHLYGFPTTLRRPVIG